MNKLFGASISAVFVMLLIANASQAEQKVPEKMECPVYGEYWQSQRWGWYGAKRNVTTPKEAKEILEKILIHHMKSMHLKIGAIREKPRFYEADIIKQGVRIDIIIIDKRSGRIRSVH